jgi:allantoinase
MFDAVVLGTVVTDESVTPGAYVAIAGEKIAEVGRGTAPAARTTFDRSGALIFPGLVDGHVHTGSALGWPGIEGTTKTAAAGGVTTCVDMPYDVPEATTDAGILRRKIAVVNETAHVDVALYGTIRKHNGVGAIAGLAEGGVCSFKLSTYEYDAVRFPRIDHPTMIAAFAEIARTGVPVSIHNEDQELVESLSADARAAGQTHALMHSRTRPALAETLADNEIFEIGLATGAHVHIAHSSVSRGFTIAETFRGYGAKASGEACIQYLCMTEDDLVRLGGIGKCNPPFRTAAEVERMWASLQDGLVAYVSTDHAPWPIERKTKADIFACSAGLVGLQSFGPLMYSLLVERGLSPSIMAKYCAGRPARHHGLAGKGCIAEGYDADLMVLQPGDFIFDQADIVDRPELRWSPYHGRRVKARVASTFLRGQLIWNDGTTLSAPGTGRFVPRERRR